MRIAIVLAIAASSLSACTSGPPVAFEGIRAGTVGESEKSAIKVGSVDAEYAIVKKLGLEPVGQALVIKGSKAFDVLTVRDPKTGEQRKIWFDASEFFGRF